MQIFASNPRLVIKEFKPQESNLKSLLNESKNWMNQHRYDVIPLIFVLFFCFLIYCSITTYARVEKKILPPQSEVKKIERNILSIYYKHGVFDIIASRVM